MCPDLAPLVDRIRELSQEGSPWALPAGEVARLLEIDVTELYRRVYAASLGERALVSLSVAVDSFGPGDGPELVSLLELFYGPEARRALARAGLFLPHEERVEILRCFLEVAAFRITSHNPDPARFKAMLKVFGRFETAAQTYLGELPSMEDLAGEAAKVYCRTRTFAIPALARATVEGTLRAYIQRKVLRSDTVYAPLRARLAGLAMREGYSAETRRPPRDEDPAVDVVDTRLGEARACLGLNGQPLTAEALRSRYRGLMKRFHPDVNPAGLARCQEINAAYALLATVVDAGVGGAPVGRGRP
jgi:hypothetical protein